MMAAGGTQLDNRFESNAIDVWQFHVDWRNPANTEVTGPEKIAVAPYYYLCDGQLTNCVPQPGIERRLDAQGDKIMPRLVYRAERVLLEQNRRVQAARLRGKVSYLSFHF